MGAGWTTGGVRARALLSRRVGAAGARAIAASPSLEEAVDRVRATPYGHRLPAAVDRAGAERAVAASVLWHLRVLAGWQPRQGVVALRALAGWFEVADVVGHARALAGRDPVPAYKLGSLATAWPRLAATTSPAALRAALARSAWRDPGTAAPGALALTLAMGWAGRVALDAPAARDWAVAGAAVLLARHRFGPGAGPGPAALRRAEAVLGRSACAAGSWTAYLAALPGPAARTLAGLAGPGELWRAERRWWRDVEATASAQVRGPSGPELLVGCAALLAVDARRLRAALQIAARGGGELEAFDAAA